jgi:hypothetical protein
MKKIISYQFLKIEKEKFMEFLRQRWTFYFISSLFLKGLINKGVLQKDTTFKI